jgi:PIN domain nuclease of toxin-antitoxin system
MNLLLDTQAFLWLDSDQARLSSPARQACSNPQNMLWLSAASAWEMQIKIALACIFHTPMETPTVRRVRARGLQARTSARVGRVPSRGVWWCEISGLGKLRLARPLAQIITDQQTANGVQVLPVQLAHVLALQDLPPHHKDPFDRLLIAQAKNEGWDIVSRDPEFKAYAVPVIW